MPLSLARVLRRAWDVDFAQNLVRHFLCVVEVIDREAQAGRIERIEEVDVEGLGEGTKQGITSAVDFGEEGSAYIRYIRRQMKFSPRYALNQT